MQSVRNWRTILDIESLQLILAEHWKPYLENLHVCMTDATCYESHLRFPTDVKLLWEGIAWLHRHLCKHCRTLHIQRPRNKYLDVAAPTLLIANCVNAGNHRLV